MTEVMPPTRFDAFSLAPELAEDAAARLATASSAELRPTTGDELPADPDLLVRLRAVEGLDEGWPFADEDAARGAVDDVGRFCTNYCPIDHRCPGAACRLYRYEHEATAFLEAAGVER